MKIVQESTTPHQGKVWKLYPDTYSGCVLCEERNEEENTVSFWKYHLTTPDRELIQLPLEENWWIGLHDFYNGKMILHLYEDGIEPIPKGVYIYDVLQGGMIYQDEKAKYRGSEEGTLSIDIEEKEFELDLNEENETITPKFDIIHPLYYSAESEHCNTIKEYLNSIDTFNLDGPIEYREYKGLVFISFYTISDAKLQNLFYVLNEEGEVIFQERLVDQVQGIGMGTFFLYEDKIWLVKNKTEVKLLMIENQ